jgi:hypothetical protein
VGLLASGVFLVLGASALWPVPAVRVFDAASQRTLARLPADEGAPLRLSYQHSIYRQPGIEEFAVRDGALRLVRLASPSMAVLEYYARPEPIVAGADGYEVRVAACEGAAPCARPASQPTLTVLVSGLGQRTLSHAGRRVPLHELAADGSRVTIQVGLAPRLAFLWAGAM